MGKPKGGFKGDCWTCGERGHSSKNCPGKSKGKGGGGGKGEPKGKGKGWWSRPGWAVEGAVQEVDWEWDGTDDEDKEDRVISLVELPDAVDNKSLVDNKGLGKSKDKVSMKGVGKVNSKVS